MTSPLSRAALPWLLSGVGCVIPDPNHCLHLDGDRTCVELGIGNYCDECLGENRGCVPEQPRAGCHASGESTAAATAGGETSAASLDDGVTSAEGSGSTGEGPACVAEGGLDPACAEASPYCVDATCATCDALPEGACAAIDPAQPMCVPGWACVQCVPADCRPDEVFCDDGTTCSGGAPYCDDAYRCSDRCTRHLDCPGSACDIAVGACFDPARVWWVDACAGTGEGTQAQPYCDLATGLQNIGEGEAGVIMLVGGGQTYGSVSLTATATKQIAIVGVDRPVLQGGTTSVSVSGTKRLYLAGVDLVGGSEAVARCTSTARLYLEDVGVRGGDAIGIETDHCRLVAERVTIVGNGGDGVSLASDSEMTLRTSIVAGNGNVAEQTRGLRLSSSTFSIVASTIVGNLSDPVFGTATAPANMFCQGGAGGPIRGSIIAGPTLDTYDCAWGEPKDTVIDAAKYKSAEVVVLDTYDPSWFLSPGDLDFHLRQADNPFADIAVWALGDPRRDIDRQPVPAYPGARAYAGADQP